MKVQLIVVQGKPEGKVIPLVGPIFKIGRGETCHLRPTSEQVSREHAEFTISGSSVAVRDLGSRNGTLVNGKALTESYTLKHRDLVQVGPLTFAVSIQDAPGAKTSDTPPPQAASKPASPDDVSHDDIESWLVADSAGSSAERPASVYGGDTITITAFKDATAPTSKAPASTPVTTDTDDEEEEYERLPEGPGDADAETEEMTDEAEAGEDEVAEDFIDESNPFYVKKKAPEAPSKPTYKDTSDAASDILRKLMDRRKSSK